MRKLLVFLFVLLSGCGKDPENTTTTAAVAPTVSSNKLINSYASNLCTQFAGDVCFFGGGQIVKYSDGSISLMGSWSALYSNGTDTDNDQQSVTLLIPSSQTAASLMMSRYVARGSGSHIVFLVYDRPTDSLTLVYDTDGSGTVSSGDTLLKTLTTSDW